MSSEQATASRSLTMRRMSSVGGTIEGGTIESFWGIELTSEKPEEVWCFKVENEEDEKDEEPDHDFMSHLLYVKMATLGKACEAGEEQVVTVETKDKDAKLVKIPVVNMVKGVNNTLNVNLEFNDRHKVVFRLAEGSGPVYLSGTCVQEFPPTEYDSQDESMFTETETATDEDEEDEDDDEDDDEEDEDEDEEMDAGKGKKGKPGMKRKAADAGKASKAKQRSRVESKEDSEEEDSEEDDDDEESEEEEETPISKKRGKPGVSPKGKSPRGKPAAKKGPAAAKAAKGKKPVKGKAK